MRIRYFNSSLGLLKIKEDQGSIVEVSPTSKKEELETETSLVIENAILQLKEYFAGSRKEFELPIKMHGTEFQKKVWQALLDIPYGKTASYKEIAEYIGNPKACRAVGGANNKNPLIILVPCHRVIGSNGHLVGFGGGLEMKEKLLNLEKKKLLISFE